MAPVAQQLERGTPQVPEVSQEDLDRQDQDLYGKIEYKEIPLEKVDVDDFQRELYPAHVSRIYREFEAPLVDAPLVNTKKGGRFSCIDGQHTVEALKAKGMKDVLAKVIDVPHAEAARLFSKQRAKSLTRPEKFTSRRVQGEPMAIKMMEVMEANGFRPYNHRDDRPMPVIRSLNEIEKIAAKFGFERSDWKRGGNLAETLAFVNEIWPTAKKRENGYFLRGVAEFLNRFDGRIDQEVRDKIAELRPIDYQADMRDYGAQDKRVASVTFALKKQAGFLARLPNNQL